MQYKITSEYKSYEKELQNFIANFDKAGKKFGNQDRNTLKLFKLGDKTINIKSFKKPNIVNKIAYRFVRKSKAQRSFEYAHVLLEKGIKTPDPIAYFQQKGLLTFGRSYYISEHLDYDLTFRDLIYDEKFPKRYKILQYFTRFTYQLHENGIEFLDHSPGNTLVIVNGQDDYDFYLVDLNRMKFHDQMDYETRIRNFRRLTPDKNMVHAMSAEYARLIGKDPIKVYNDMWRETENFFEKRKKKSKLKFWK